MRDVAFAAVLSLAAIAVTACSDDGRELAEPEVTTTTAAAVLADPGTTADLPTPIASPAHGSTAWAVYLATGTAGDDPAIEDAVARADEQGFDVTVGQLACDIGAPDALGLTPETFAAALYFEVEEDARAFLDAYEPRAVAVAKVQISCAD